MKGGRDFAAQSDPGRNPHFSRTWGNDPLRLPGFRHLGRELAPEAVEALGRRAIGHWLDKASDSHGNVAARAFQQADKIRRKLGLAWEDLIDQRIVA